jgi:hypothetical protein
MRDLTRTWPRNGGAIHARDGLVIIEQSTIYNNYAGNNTGGIIVTGWLMVRNSIVAGNAGGDFTGNNRDIKFSPLRQRRPGRRLPTREVRHRAGKCIARRPGRCVIWIEQVKLTQTIKAIAFASRIARKLAGFTTKSSCQRRCTWPTAIQT